MSQPYNHARRLFEISGTDKVNFLQGLVTNDVSEKSPPLVYAALLTPQGKLLTDFFLCFRDKVIMLDVDAEQADALIARLSMYKLRADVAITPRDDLSVVAGLGPMPDGAISDPRHDAMGWRWYGPADQVADICPSQTPDWDRLRIDNLIPQMGRDMPVGETYILEMGFERLNGVDFRKGCYVGQEVTARMKHKTELKKGLTRVRLGAPVAEGTQILNEAGKEVGTVLTASPHYALAYLRFDRISGTLSADGVGVTFDGR